MCLPKFFEIGNRGLRIDVISSKRQGVEWCKNIVDKLSESNAIEYRVDNDEAESPQGGRPVI